MCKKFVLLSCLSCCVLFGMESEFFKVEIRPRFGISPTDGPAYSVYPILITNKTRNSPQGFRSFDCPIKTITYDAGAKHIGLVQLGDGSVCKIDLRDGKELK